MKIDIEIDCSADIKINIQIINNIVIDMQTNVKIDIIDINIEIDIKDIKVEPYNERSAHYYCNRVRDTPSLHYEAQLIPKLTLEPTPMCENQTCDRRGREKNMLVCDFGAFLRQKACCVISSQENSL
jgi:hypothetical protein